MASHYPPPPMASPHRPPSRGTSTRAPPPDMASAYYRPPSRGSSRGPPPDMPSPHYRPPSRGTPPRTSSPRTLPPRNSPPRNSPPRHSPPRASPPRTSPPRRRPALHERSNSRNNERSSRMLRMVVDPDASTYGTTPYPTKTSHVLAPPRKSEERSSSPLSTKTSHILAPPRQSEDGASSPFDIVARAQARLRQHTPEQETSDEDRSRQPSPEQESPPLPTRGPWVPSNATKTRRNEAASQPLEEVEKNEESPSADVTVDSAARTDTFSATTPDVDPDSSSLKPASLQPNSPDLNTNNSFLDPETSDSDRGRPSGESVVQLPSVPPRADEIGYAVSSAMTEPFDSQYADVPPDPPARAEGHVNPMPSPLRNHPLHHQPLNKESDASLGSTNSTGTVIVKKTRDTKKRASYSAFPTTRPGSSKSSLAVSTPTKPNHPLSRNPSDDSAAPVSPVSPSSPVSAAYVPPTERPVSSIPAYTSLQEANRKPVEVQYPVVKPPTASGSWAETVTPPQRPHKPVERNQERWNPHLSTVQSVGSSSPTTGDRDSQSTWPIESSRDSKSSSNLTKWSPRISTDFPAVPRRSSDFVKPVEFSPTLRGSSDAPPVPSPNPSRLASPPPVRQKEFTGTTIRRIDEHEVSASTAQPARPSSRRPSRNPFSPDPQKDKKRSSARTSRMSFLTDSIPAWAKAYYARPDSALLIPRSDSVGDILDEKNGRKGSKDMLGGRPKELTLAETHGLPQRNISTNWSPHLWHDRKSLGRRRSLFQAPSIDERAEGQALTKRNLQIGLFAVGFLMPLAWFIAAFLPLPPQPDVPSAKGKENPYRTQITEDLEKALSPHQEARYENARWWRNINRFMAFVGIVIIAAVIALAVIGTH